MKNTPSKLESLQILRRDLDRLLELLRLRALSQTRRTLSTCLASHNASNFSRPLVRVHALRSRLLADVASMRDLAACCTGRIRGEQVDGLVFAGSLLGIRDGLDGFADGLTVGADAVDVDDRCRCRGVLREVGADCVGDLLVLCFEK